MSFSESRGKISHLNYPKINFSNFDLWISDNAQGKSRAIRSFIFICDLSSGKKKIILTNFKGKFYFDFQGKRKSDSAKITYEIEIRPRGGENIYIEKIFRNKIPILSPKTLIDESKDKPVKNFFIPPNIPALVSLTDKRFKTISLVRNFFKSALFINAGKTNIVISDPDAQRVDPAGTNIADFASNLKNNYPDIFNEWVSDFKSRFKLVQNVTIKKMLVKGVKINLLFFKEKGIQESIEHREWSDGMYRLFWLLSSTKTPILNEKAIHHPSIVFIDEIENGLDFKTLKFILNYLKEYSRHNQFVMTSHSPLVGDLIELDHWKVFKRQKHIVKVFQPELVEKDFEKIRKEFKYKNYELYIRHISKSSQYKVN